MEKVLKEALLYDFYGELLTLHQKEIYEDFVLNDLSLGEIAEQRSISRQGVYDIVRRCRRQLQGYEDRLHMVDRFVKIRKNIEEIDSLTASLEESSSSETASGQIRRIRELADLILQEV